MVLRVLPMLCLLGLTTVSPAEAALRTPDAYAAEVVDIGLSGAEDTKRQICVPPDRHYIFAFIRDANGTIIGIQYIVIKYGC
ncbi:hypothetical protein LJR255_003463 [Pararhizobium sp. LjRoot255]|uniref:hypothetical protein n=1 Tax=Pararhizobium sp. LjRoot255 TaxID=3342298 RepID=UPI003ECF511F